MGYNDTRKEILIGLRNGHSFAIIGGRRCGKTSLLMQIEKDILRHKDRFLSPCHPIPVRFSVQEFDYISPDRLFDELYQGIAKQVDGAKAWKNAKNGRDYDNLKRHLKPLIPKLEQKFGPDFLIIFLIDELDASVDKLPDDMIFQNLRNFLMEYKFNRHFRLIATGVADMARLISSGASPLNNLVNKFLTILDAKSALKLVHAGFPKMYDTQDLFQITGKHPYLLQAILAKLYEKNDWSKAAIKKAGAELLKEQSNHFRRWLSEFDNDVIAVYNCLAQAPVLTMNFFDIKKQTQVNDVDMALSILSYHGIIDADDPDEPEIAGTFFRKWFLRNVSEPVAPEKPVGEPSKNDTGIHIQFKPDIRIDNSPTFHQGISNENVELLFKQFDRLQQELGKLKVDKKIQQKAAKKIQEAKKEVSNQPNQVKIKQGLKDATDVIQSASKTTGAVQAFVNKAYEIISFLGTVLSSG